jgi:hypothetical protein
MQMVQEQRRRLDTDEEPVDIAEAWYQLQQQAQQQQLQPDFWPVVRDACYYPRSVNLWPCRTADLQPPCHKDPEDPWH